SARAPPGCPVSAAYSVLLAAVAAAGPRDELIGAREDLEWAGHIEALHAGVGEDDHLSRLDGTAHEGDHPPSAACPQGRISNTSCHPCLGGRSLATWPVGSRRRKGSPRDAGAPWRATTAAWGTSP